MLKEAGILICGNEQHIGGSGSELGVGSNSVPTGTEQLGIYVGEGMTPVPKKTRRKDLAVGICGHGGAIARRLGPGKN